MWPWGHLGAGYLLYSGLCRFSGQRPTELGALALVVGTQMPDLIDKPFAWTLDILPNGRSLSHSLLGAFVLITLVTLVVSRYDRRDVGYAFGFGYLVHLGTDALYPALSGDWYELGFLGWPFVPAIEYETKQSFLAHFAQFEFGLPVWFEIALFVGAGLLWYADGRPGWPRFRWFSWEKVERSRQDD